MKEPCIKISCSSGPINNEAWSVGSDICVDQNPKKLTDKAEKRPVAKTASHIKSCDPDYLKPETRPNGYYKIRYLYDTAVALWMNGHWCFCGDTRGFSDDNLEITAIELIEI